jgi:hypothetical protein
MSTSVSKRALIARTTNTRTTPIAGAVAPSAFERGAVERATDLGNGYIIVKVAPSAVPQSPREAQLPKIPKGQVLRLLARLSDTEASTEAAGTAKERVTRTTPENNAGLLADLDDKAMARRQALHERGELLTSAQICERLGISRQALSKAIRDRRMFWIEGSNGAQWYPGFFADHMTSRRDLERVSFALADLPGAVKWQFFTMPKHSLAGRTPIEAVKNGELEQVLRTAAETMERNLGR